MRRKTLAAILISGLVAAALVAPAAPAAAKKKKAGPLVVGTDPEGDWGAAVAPELAPVGAALGQDLVEASIGMADKTTVDFVMKVTSLPAAGGWPEITRYTWDMTVDGNFLELDGKFTNYSRGVCDPTSGQCPPPRDPGQAPFFVRADCAPNEANVTICQEVGIVQATFNASEGTITVPVSLELLRAKPGSKLAPGTNIFGGSISATPSAFFTSSAMPLDTLTVTKTFVVPRK